MPEAEHRFCVMHLFNNMQKDHRAFGIKKLTWFAARATTDFQFKKNTDAIKKV